MFAGMMRGYNRNRQGARRQRKKGYNRDDSENGEYVNVLVRW